IVSEKICRYYRENGNVGRHPYAMIKKTTRNAIIDYIRHRAATSAEEAVSIDGDDDDLIALVESLADPDADTEGVAILHLTIEPRVAYVEAHLTDGQRRCLYLYKDVQDGHCTVDEAVAIGGYANRASYYALVSRARKRRDELLKEWEEQGNGTRAVRTLE
ncbi:MAG: hypothetical protein ACREMY_11070, partial [bacterium]